MMNPPNSAANSNQPALKGELHAHQAFAGAPAAGSTNAIGSMAGTGQSASHPASKPAIHASAQSTPDVANSRKKGMSVGDHKESSATMLPSRFYICCHFSGPYRRSLTNVDRPVDENLQHVCTEQSGRFAYRCETCRCCIALSSSSISCAPPAPSKRRPSHTPLLTRSA